MFGKPSSTYSFEQLYKENYARLYYYAFRFITDEEVCKDMVNDVFEKAWQNFGNLKSETASAYLYAQLRNRCIDYLRHQQVKEQYADFYRGKLCAEVQARFRQKESDGCSRFSPLQVILEG